MQKNILVDTGPLVALINSRETTHQSIKNAISHCIRFIIIFEIQYVNLDIEIL